MSWRRRNRRKTTRTVASRLCWATFSKEALPSSLTENPHKSDDAIDHSEKNDGKATDSYLPGKKVESFRAHATNWDAILDAKGIPTDGTPPDPLESERIAEQFGIPSLDEQQEQGLGTGTGQPSGAPSTPPGLSPAPPGAHQKAAQKKRAGRGVEGEEAAGLGCSVGPSNPMDNPDNLNWDSLNLPGQPPLPANGY